MRGRRIRTLWAGWRGRGAAEDGLAALEAARTSAAQHRSGVRVGDGLSPQPSQGQGRADRDPRNRMVLNESKSLPSRQMALCLQTQDGERRGRRVGIKAGGMVIRDVTRRIPLCLAVTQIHSCL